MISTVCFVVLLGCVLTQASPLLSKFELPSSEKAMINNAMKEFGGNTAAVAAVGLKLSNDVIGESIHSSVEALPNAIADAIKERLGIPDFKISKQLQEVIKDASTSVAREVFRFPHTVNRISKVPMQVVVAATAPFSSSPH